MGRTWVNGHWRNKRKSTRMPSGDLGCFGPLFLVGGIFIVLIVLCQTVSSHSGLLVFLVPAAIAGFVIFMSNKQKREEIERRKDQEYQQYIQQVQAQSQAEQHYQQMVYREQVRVQQAIQQENARQLQAQKERERLARLKTLGDLLTLTPTEFEEAVGQILASGGFLNVRRVGGSGDLSVDLLATDVYGNRVIVQCKRYSPGRSIGSPDLQKFIGMMVVQHKAQKGIFVTTSTFKQTAIDLAKDKDITLIDGNTLVRLMQGMTM